MNSQLQVNRGGDIHFLGMGEGLDRFKFFRGFPHKPIDNRTDDIFNHTRSTGGYNNYGKTIIPNHSISPLNPSGIVTLAPPKNYDNQVTQSAIINRLVNAPVNYKVNALIDAALPQNTFTV